MITVASAVEDIVSRSDFAIEGLETGCLNMSEYAATILHEVELITKKPVHKGSVVMALSRLAPHYRKHARRQSFTMHNLVSRTGLAELAYPKTRHTQSCLARLHEREYVRGAPFFVATVGLNELSLIADADLVAKLRQEFSGQQPTLAINDLASLTMQVDIASIDTPRQSYTVIKQLALREITIVEYVTSPSELTIILYERDLKQAFTLLYDKFFA